MKHGKVANNTGVKNVINEKLHTLNIQQQQK